MTGTIIVVIIAAILTAPFWIPLFLAILFWISWGCWAILTAIDSLILRLENFFLKLRKK